MQVNIYRALAAPKTRSRVPFFLPLFQLNLFVLYLAEQKRGKRKNCFCAESLVSVYAG
jgi:hypothetical protein